MSAIASRANSPPLYFRVRVKGRSSGGWLVSSACGRERLSYFAAATPWIRTWRY